VGVPAAGGLIEIRAGARKDGTLTAWEQHNYNSGPSAIETPYEMANQLAEYHPALTPLRQGSYRALAATANNFARSRTWTRWRTRWGWIRWSSG